MKCVILAAGSSRRLRPLTAASPKCLLKIGGNPLLRRLIEHVRAAGFSRIAIVTGFGSEKVRQFLKNHGPKRKITEIRNERYSTTNNLYSLWLAKDFIGSEGFLLLDSDLLFGPGLLPFFLRHERYSNRLAVRVRGPHDEEEVRVKINRWDQIKRIGKEIPLRESYGESIGIALFSRPATPHLFRILEERIAAGSGKKEFYEAAFQQFIDEGKKLWAVDVSDFPSVEIDTHEDLDFAQRTVLPLIEHV